MDGLGPEGIGMWLVLSSGSRIPTTRGGYVLFIGHTRFSLFDPTSGGWRASNGSRFGTVEEYQSYLFAAERLDPRCDIFVNHSLPQLARAADGFEVAHVVSYSAALPAKYRAILKEAAEKFSFLVLDEQVDGKPTTTPLAVARKHHRGDAATKEPGSAFGLYRLDDDDLLPADYFTQVAPYLRPENAGMMVSLGAGATALYVDGAYYNVRQCYAPMIAIGLLSICRFAEDGALIQPGGIAHNFSDRKNPVILDSRKIGFLWTRHAQQDTSLGWGNQDETQMADIIRKYMAAYPEASADDGFAEAFPAIADSLYFSPGPDNGTLQVFDEERALSEEPAVFPLAKLGGRVDVAMSVECDAETIPNNAIISFSLVDSDGHQIEASPDRLTLAGTGLAMSSNPGIGYYAYLKTAKGRTLWRHALTLPPGVFLQAFSVSRFRRAESLISISQVGVQEVHNRRGLVEVVTGG